MVIPGKNYNVWRETPHFRFDELPRSPYARGLLLAADILRMEVLSIRLTFHQEDAYLFPGDVRLLRLALDLGANHWMSEGAPDREARGRARALDSVHVVWGYMGLGPILSASGPENARGPSNLLHEARLVELAGINPGAAALLDSVGKGVARYNPQSPTGW